MGNKGFVSFQFSANPTIVSKNKSNFIYKYSSLLCVRFNFYWRKKDDFNIIHCILFHFFHSVFINSGNVHKSEPSGISYFHLLAILYK
jgi:hypothetical protein